MCLGVPGEVQSFTDTEPLTRTAVVKFGGITKEINLAFTPEAQVGDWVIVHAGFAINTLDQQEAARTLALLDEEI